MQAESLPNIPQMVVNSVAYLALWVELLLNVFNYYYTKSYGKIYQAEDDTTSSSESDKLP